MNVLHVLPVNDMREHQDQDCPCHPDVDIAEGGGLLVIHHAYDKRELRERKQVRA